MKIFDNLIFEGCYAELCIRFIKYKKSLGYCYTHRQCHSIKYLNDYLAVNADDTKVLSKKLVEGYIARRKGEAVATHRKRIFIIRQFAVFLSSLGYDAYQPPFGRIKADKNFVPYIYTKEEISAIVKASEHLQYTPVSPTYHLVYPMLLRLLFGCGLRISEALHLTFQDVDLDEGILTIKSSKFNSSRLVPMSRSVWDYSLRYCAKMNFNSTYSGYFFPSRKGRPYRVVSAYAQFRNFLQIAGIPHRGRGNGPRMHDARHTYAVNALEHMVRQGMDIYCALPILSTYMGHRTIESTEKYVRLVPSEYKNIISAMSPLYSNLFPEVSDHE